MKSHSLMPLPLASSVMPSAPGGTVARLAAGDSALHVVVPDEAKNIVRVAQDHLAAALAEEYECFELKALTLPKPNVLPAGAIALHPRLPGRLYASRRICVWVDVLLNGAPYRSMPIWFEVSARRLVLVAISALPAGTIVAPAQFVAQLRDVSRFPAGLAALPNETAALRLRRALQADQVLIKDHLEPVPAVKRNQEVIVHVKIGDVRVEGGGIALADGKVGAMIRVRNARSKEIFRARVVGNGVVALSEQ